MPFTDKPQVFGASINALTVGAEGREIVLGGSNVLPLYSFDAPIPNAPRVGVEVSDRGYDKTVPGLAEFYAGCETVPEQAKKACTMEGCDFIVLTLDSADPNAENTSVEDCVELVKAVYDAIDKPLAVIGSKNIEKDADLFVKVADAMRGKNILCLSCREENYKQVGAGVVLAAGCLVGGESAVDINLAKQLNVLLSQLGIPSTSVVMNLGSAAAGYGFEYLASTIERVKNAALTQNDQALQMPVVTIVGDDAWSVKETLLEESEEPEWGPREERGIQMEIETAAACIACGSDAVLLRHPVAVKTIADMIKELV